MGKGAREPAECQVDVTREPDLVEQVESREVAVPSRGIAAWQVAGTFTDSDPQRL